MPTQTPMDTCTNTRACNKHMHRHTHAHTSTLTLPQFHHLPSAFVLSASSPYTGAQLLSLTFSIMMAEAAKDDSLHWCISPYGCPCRITPILLEVLNTYKLFPLIQSICKPYFSHMKNDTTYI